MNLSHATKWEAAPLPAEQPQVQQLAALSSRSCSTLAHTGDCWNVVIKPVWMSSNTPQHNDFV